MTFHRIAFVVGAAMMIAALASCNGNTQCRQFLEDNYANGKVSDTLLKEATPGAAALIGCCLYYESELQKGITAGQKWVYTNRSEYAPQNTSFDHMVESGHWGTNCALPASWVLVDLGVMEEGLRFWGDSNGGFAKLDNVRSSIEKAATITQLDGTRTFSELFAAGLVKPGDIFLTYGHTFIYLGDDLFFAAGHDGKWHSDPTAGTEDKRQAVFDSWLMPRESCHDNECRPTWQISFREDFVPAFRRNKDGMLVKCRP